MDRPWLAQYPDGVPADLAPHSYRSLVDVLEESFERFAASPAFYFMDATLTYRRLDRASRAFAGYLQSLGLAKGDRVMLMMPNVPQYPVALAGALRAGMTVVNANPLYTPCELEHLLTDSGARVAVVLQDVAEALAACQGATGLEHVVVTTIGDAFPWYKGWVVDLVRTRKGGKTTPMVEGAAAWRSALRRGRAKGLSPVEIGPEDVALLQYTGGTTGAPKAATLLHRNVIANTLQAELWFEPAMKTTPAGEQRTFVCALPLYHIFGFTVSMMLALRTGGVNILIPNPRDLPALFKELGRRPFHLFPAVNTLFAAIARHPRAKTVDWSSLKLSVGGGMTVQPKTAELWQDLTGTPICEGYGLSETSPVISCNSTSPAAFTKCVGLPLPSTEMAIVDDDGRRLGVGEKGEIVVRGPQVMPRYWNDPEETAAAMLPDGFFRTGDIGVMDETGHFCIVDRKKDTINVSGFTVHPSEIEAVVLKMPGVVEAAAVAMPHEVSGEAVRLVVVTSDPTITASSVKAFCRTDLTGYKRPHVVEFRDELPKSGVGKVLRRMLRDV
ncbi:AMP-binding protein [Consotaella aegiceratis]|uniref:AMP-binding protein n=1 Tax=Consotaella aegiceratis TaxID=3097961 RepID=UPI002F3E5500